MAARRPDPLRAELYFGAVYGLGLSSVIWAAVLFPPHDTTSVLALGALAVAAGLVPLRLPGIGRCSPVPAVALAALALSGVAVGVICAAVSGLIAALATGFKTGLRPRHATFRAVVVAMAAFIAGLVYVAAGGPIGTGFSRAAWLPAIAHAGAFVAVHEVLSGLAASHSAVFATRRARLEPAVRLALAAIGSPVAAGLSVTLFRIETAREGLMVLAAAVLVYRLGRLRALRGSAASRQPALRSALTRTLTKAVAAGDRAVEQRLWRVQGLCLAVGERLELDTIELEALGAAALLHDVGKVGAPHTGDAPASGPMAHELTSVRRHPAFGAELLSSIGLSEPVCSIVHHHHERWDGRGYPDGLAGRAIPMGARVLAAVDNYDALTAHRPGRRAVPAGQARRHLEREAGKTFDPAVVDALTEVLDRQGQPGPNLVDVADVEDAAHAPGPASNRTVQAPEQLTTLYDLKRVTSYPIDLQDCLNLSAERLAQLIPHRTLVVYVRDDPGRSLEAAFATGQGADVLGGATLSLADTFSGWVVRHRRARFDDGSTEAGLRDSVKSDLASWLDDPRLAGLETMLAAPLTAGGECHGALTLYDRPGRDFSGEERRRLGEAAGYVAHAVLRARRTPRAAECGHTDRLTGLPDGRYLLRDAAERLATSSSASTELGFLAFQVSRTTEAFAARFGADAVERGLCEIARRLADHCGPRETLARFGPDTFLVVSPVDRGDQLLERWNGFIRAVEARPLDLGGDEPAHAKLVSAHAGYPADGNDLDSVIARLSSRLDLAADRGATIVPFRAGARSAS